MHVVGVAVGGTAVSVAVGTGVSDGTGVDVAVGGTDVPVGGTEVDVGGTAVFVAVAGTAVFVRVGVLVSTTAVEVGPTGVLVG